METQHKHKTSILILSFILTSTTLFAAHDIDEWRSRTTRIAADTALTDSMKVVILSDLTYNYFYYYRTFDEQYLDEYLQIAERFVNNEHQNDLLSYIYSTAVVIARGERATQMKEKCEYYTHKSTNPLIRAQSWERLGRKHITDPAGLNYLSRALDAVKGTTGYAAQSGINGYIALYYSIQGDTANQMKYALRSLELAQQSGNPRQQITAWESMAEAYSYQNDYPAAIEAYSNAREIYLGQQKSPEPDPDLRYRDDMHYMVMLVNLGSMHFNTGNLDTAARIINEAFETATRHSFVETQAYCSKELGRIYTALKKYPTAETHLLRAATLLSTDYIKTTESDYIDYEVKLALAHLYNLMGKYQQSAEYYNQGISQYRRMHDEEQMALNQQYAATYEARIRDEAIARMETVVAYHERRHLLYAAIFLIILAAVYVVARLYRTRINLTRQKEETLRAQGLVLKLSNRKAELDNQLKQQEAEALRQKLTLGNQLCEDLNQSLRDVTTFFNRHPELGPYHSQVKNIIHQQSRIDSNIEEYKQGITDVPPDFYARLQNIAENKLTALDLKYCRLMYLQTPIKEIAELMSVEPKTVRMVKYRIKQKLSLDKADDLNEFIFNLAQQ